MKRRPTRKIPPILLLLGLFSIAFPLFSCSPSCSPTEEDDPKLHPNILLLTLDTLRQDRLGCYGYEKAKTPHLDQIAETGTRMTRAYTAVPVTLPSHASILLGNYPFIHGLRDNAIAGLGSRHELISESLGNAGYQTSAFVSATVLGAQYGLDEGFDKYDDDVSDSFGTAGWMPDRPANKTTDRVIEHLSQTLERNHAPFFTWVHYFDPHQPWEAPEPFSSQLEDPYDAEIAFLDYEIGRLLRFIDDRGLSDNTIVVAVADHGEGLGENGEDTHGFFIYEGTVLVPMMIRGPGVPKGVLVEELVRTIDIAPTLLELAGVESTPVVQGRSLSPLWNKVSDDALRSAYIETYLPNYGFGWAWMEGWIQGHDKYIDSPKPERFDLETDAREKNNLYGIDSNRDEFLHDALSSTKEDRPSNICAQDAVSLESTTEEMAALILQGYIASGAPELTKDRGPDVKDVYPSLKMREIALQHFREGQFDRAIPLLRQFKAATTNRPARAQEILGSALASKASELVQAGLKTQAQPFLNEALSELTECVEAMPIYYDAQLSLGLVYRLLGDQEKQELHLKKALDLHPASKAARHFLGLICVSKKRWDEAIVHFEAHLEKWEPNDKTPDTYAPMSAILLGNAYFETEDLVRAHEAYSRAMSIDPAFIDATFYLGRIAQKQEDLEKALSLYQQFVTQVAQSTRKIPPVLVQEAKRQIQILGN